MTKTQTIPPSEITTARTRLRRFNAGDVDNLVQLESDPEVMKFTSLRVALSREQTEARLQTILANEEKNAPLGIWAAEFRDSGLFIGWFMLIKTSLEDPEIGFMIVQKYWGMGLTAEIARRLADHAFQHFGVRRIAAVTDPKNAASMRVLDKAGFQAAGTVNRLNAHQGKEIELNLFLRPAGPSLED